MPEPAPVAPAQPTDQIFDTYKQYASAFVKRGLVKADDPPEAFADVMGKYAQSQGKDANRHASRMLVAMRGDYGPEWQRRQAGDPGISGAFTGALQKSYGGVQMAASQEPAPYEEYVSSPASIMGGGFQIADRSQAAQQRRESTRQAGEQNILEGAQKESASVQAHPVLGTAASMVGSLPKMTVAALPGVGAIAMGGQAMEGKVLVEHGMQTPREAMAQGVTLALSPLAPALGGTLGKFGAQVTGRATNSLATAFGAQAGGRIAQAATGAGQAIGGTLAVQEPYIAAHSALSGNYGAYTDPKEAALSRLPAAGAFGLLGGAMGGMRAPTPRGDTVVVEPPKSAAPPVEQPPLPPPAEPFPSMREAFAQEPLPPQEPPPVPMREFGEVPPLEPQMPPPPVSMDALPPRTSKAVRAQLEPTLPVERPPFPEGYPPQEGPTNVIPQQRVQVTETGQQPTAARPSAEPRGELPAEAGRNPSVEGGFKQASNRPSPDEAGFVESEGLSKRSPQEQVPAVPDQQGQPEPVLTDTPEVVAAKAEYKAFLDDLSPEERAMAQSTIDAMGDGGRDPLGAKANVEQHLQFELGKQAKAAKAEREAAAAAEAKKAEARAREAEIAKVAEENPEAERPMTQAERKKAERARKSEKRQAKEAALPLEDQLRIARKSRKPERVQEVLGRVKDNPDAARMVLEKLAKQRVVAERNLESSTAAERKLAAAELTRIDNEIGYLTGEGAEPREHRAGSIEGDIAEPRMTEMSDDMPGDGEDFGSYGMSRRGSASLGGGRRFGPSPVEQAVGKAAKAVGGAVKAFAQGPVPVELQRMVEQFAGEGDAQARAFVTSTRRLMKDLKTRDNYELAHQYMVDPNTEIPAGKEFVRTAVDKIRPELADIQKKLADTPGISDELKGTINESLGTYQHRRYKANIPEYGQEHEKFITSTPEGARIIEAAKRELIESGYSPDEANNQINDSLGVYRKVKEGAERGGGVKGPAQPGALKGRTDIGPAMRKLKGEITEAPSNVADTAATIINITTKRRIQDALEKHFVGEHLFAKVPEGETGYVKTTLANGHEYYVKPAVKQWLEQSTNPMVQDPVLRIGQKLARIAKSGVYELSTTTAASGQFLGNALMMLKSGHTGLGSWDGLTSIARRIKAVGDWEKSNWGKSGEEYRQELIHYGVFGKDSADLAQLAHLARTAHKIGVTGYFEKLMSGPRKLVQESDRLVKVNAYEMEKTTLRRLHPDWTDEQVKATAADRVANTYPTFSRQAHIPAKAGQIAGGLFSGFTGFINEVPRNFKNAAKYAAEDFKSDKMTGIKRAAALATAVGAVSMLEGLTRTSQNVTPEEEAALRAQNSYGKYDKLWFGRDANGGLTATSIGRYDPLQFFRSAVAAGTDKNETAGGKLLNFVEAASAPYRSGPLVGAAQRAMEPGLTVGERVQKAGEAITPGMVRHGIKAATADTPEERKSEAWRAIIGGGVYGEKKPQALGFRLKEINDEADTALGAIRRKANKAKGLAPEGQAEQQKIEAERRVKLEQAVEEARALKIPEPEIARTIAEGLGQRGAKTAGALVTGDEAKPSSPEVALVKDHMLRLRRDGGPELDVGLLWDNIPDTKKGVYVKQHKDIWPQAMRSAALYKAADKLLQGASELPPDAQKRLAEAARKILDQIDAK